MIDCSSGASMIAAVPAPLYWFVLVCLFVILLPIFARSLLKIDRLPGRMKGITNRYFFEFFRTHNDRSKKSENLQKEDKISAEKQRLHEERFKLALDVSAWKLAYWEWDMVADRIFWSPELIKLVGHSPNEFGGNYAGYISRLHPDDREKMHQEIQNSILTRQSYEVEFRTLDKGGSIRWFLGKGKANYDAAGKVFKLFGIVIETTERKQTDAAVQQSEVHHRALANSIPAIIFTANKAGEVDYFNQRWGEYTGVDSSAAYGRGWLDIIHADDRERVKAAWLVSVEEGCPFAAEVRLRSKKMAYCWFVMRALPLLQQDSTKIEKWFGSFSDIHDLKNLEKKLQETDHRKNEFLSMLAHELRNPLAPVRNGLEILHDQCDGNPVIQKTLVMMDRQVSDLVHLVDDLLDVARITSGKTSLKKERVYLPDIIAHAAETCDPLVKSRQQQLNIFLDDEPVYLYADPLRLTQVFSNLLSNASKYTDNNGSITIASKSFDTYTHVTITDDGMGIAPEVIPYLFELFSQSNRTLDRSQGGLGIGLTIAKSLVEKHGGEISASSAGPGQGSQFTVTLPRLSWQEDDVYQSREAFAPRLEKTDQLSVLIVEDNVDIAESLALMLTLWDIRVAKSSDGFQALEAIKPFNPDVILLDIGLPKMNGYEVAKKIRSDGLIKDGAVLIALTGYGQDMDRVRSLEAGFDLHLVKPVDTKVLKKILLDFAKTRVLAPAHLLLS